MVLGWSYGTLVVMDYIREYGTGRLSSVVLTGALGGIVPFRMSASDDARGATLAEASRLRESPDFADRLKGADIVVDLLTAKPAPPPYRQLFMMVGFMFPNYARVPDDLAEPEQPGPARPAAAARLAGAGQRRQRVPDDRRQGAQRSSARISRCRPTRAPVIRCFSKCRSVSTRSCAPLPRQPMPAPPQAHIPGSERGHTPHGFSEVGPRRPGQVIAPGRGAHAAPGAGRGEPAQRVRPRACPVAGEAEIRGSAQSVLSRAPRMESRFIFYEDPVEHQIASYRIVRNTLDDADVLMWYHFTMFAVAPGAASGAGGALGRHRVFASSQAGGGGLPGARAQPVVSPGISAAAAGPKAR